MTMLKNGAAVITFRKHHPAKENALWRCGIHYQISTFFAN